MKVYVVHWYSERGKKCSKEHVCSIAARTTLRFLLSNGRDAWMKVGFA